MKILLDKENADIIFSDQVVSELPKTFKKSKVKKSKSLKTTCECDNASLRASKSESYTEEPRADRNRIPTSPQTIYERTRKLFDGMPNYTILPIFTRKTWPKPSDSASIATGHLASIATYDHESKATGHPASKATYDHGSKAICDPASITPCNHECRPPYDSSMTKSCKRFEIPTCICGSAKCKEDSVKLTLSQMELTEREAKLIACVCGSGICTKEANKIFEALLKNKKAEAMQKAKEQIHKEENLKKMQKQKEQSKAREKINKMKAACKIKRRRRRQILDEDAQKQVKEEISYASDGALVGMSFRDVGKMGVSCVSKLRPSKDPCYSPADDEIYASRKRIKYRMGSMKTTKTLKAIRSGEYFCKAQRSPLKFGCNEIYMQTLKKRPCLWVYCKWPAFYPKCISLLIAWRQFCHMSLFVLAMILWSPCVICVALVRLLC